MTFMIYIEYFFKKNKHKQYTTTTHAHLDDTWTYQMCVKLSLSLRDSF